MAKVNFDTSEVVKRMRHAGMPGAQAEELAGAIRDSQENLANEDDMEK